MVFLVYLKSVNNFTTLPSTRQKTLPQGLSWEREKSRKAVIIQHDTTYHTTKDHKGRASNPDAWERVTQRKISWRSCPEMTFRLAPEYPQGGKNSLLTHPYIKSATSNFHLQTFINYQATGITPVPSDLVYWTKSLRMELKPHSSSCLLCDLIQVT